MMTRHRPVTTPISVLTWLVFALTALLPAQARAAEHGSPSAPQPFATAEKHRVLLPLIAYARLPVACPVAGEVYEVVPVLPPPTNRAAAGHPDLNLAVRGSKAVGAARTLVDYGGATDVTAPQFAAMFADRRLPGFTSTHQVYQWDWGCDEGGCRGPAITAPPVTLLGMSTAPGELLFAPLREVEIHRGGYLALVLYAEERRLTLKYTREDNVIRGYTVHLENVCVDPNLLALYQQSNLAGRATLPALRAGQPLGTAMGPEIRAAVRDNGAFLDPRSRKDWWQVRR